VVVKMVLIILGGLAAFLALVWVLEERDRRHRDRED
jgi:hypothetical protein